MASLQRQKKATTNHWSKKRNKMNPNQENHSVDEFMRSVDDQCRPTFQAAHWDQLNSMLDQLPTDQPPSGERQQDTTVGSQSSAIPPRLLISASVLILSASLLWFSTGYAGSPNLKSLGTFIQTDLLLKAPTDGDDTEDGTLIGTMDHRSAERETSLSQSSDSKGEVNVAGSKKVIKNTDLQSDHDQSSQVVGEQEGATSQEQVDAPLLDLHKMTTDSLSKTEKHDEDLPTTRKKKFLFW